MKKLTLAAMLCGLATSPAQAGSQLSSTPFQTAAQWGAQWNNLRDRSVAGKVAPQCDSVACAWVFKLRNGVGALLIQPSGPSIPRSYCFLTHNAPTSDCYDETGAKTVWALDGAASAVRNVDAVPIMVGNARAHISVMLGGRGMVMLIDTGATNSVLPADVADQLVASGAATEVEPGKSQMADGSIVDVRNLVVNTLTIGTHTLNNVHVGVAPVGAEPLLGFDVLSYLGKFSIDAATSQLTFN